MKKRNILISIIAIVAVCLVAFLVTKNLARAPIQSAKIEEGGHQPLVGSGEYALNPTESVLRAEGKKPLVSGYSDAGSVNFNSGSITLTNGIVSGTFSLDMNSIAVQSTGTNSGQSTLENDLKSANFFDVANYPEGTFEIKSAEKSDTDDLYMVTGDLTIKGITQPITFPAVIYMKGGQLKAEGSVDFNRVNWGITYNSDKLFQNLQNRLIGDDFNIEFDITADPK